MDRYAMTETAEVYACLSVREFPIQALLRFRPELRDKPCVVMEGEPPLQEVCSLTQKARQRGVACGMTQVEVDTFSDVTVLQRSPKEEAAAKDALLECADCFSPRIECSNPGRSFNPDRFFFCVIDIAGTTRLFGPPEALARSFLTRVEALGVIACVAISSNYFAAVTFAKGISPRTIHVIPPGDQRATLAPLPLQVLDLTEDQAATFALWGIRTLGMLAELPEKELISRMGQPGKRLRQLARGEAPHLFQPVEPVFTLQERMELDSPVECLDALMFVANLMLEQLTLRATARVLALASVSVTLTLERGAAYTRTIRPALPSNDRQLWIRLIHLDLETHPPQAAILTVALDAEPGSTSQAQLGLFSPQVPEASRLDVTLARIRAIVGDENIGRAVLTDTHQMDGFRIEPFDVSSVRVAASPPTRLRPAMRRLRPAEAVFVTLQSDRPRAFRFRSQHYLVERAYGPWLTSGQWWGATRWECEQWDFAARSPDGAMFCGCLTRDLLRDEWKMAAFYD